MDAPGPWRAPPRAGPARPAPPRSCRARPALRLLLPAGLLETTPEIARLVRDADGWREIRGLTAEQLDDTVPEFRRFPNLFEILTFDYWHLAHGFEPTPESQRHRTAYLSTPGGRAHLTALARIRMRARATAGADADPIDERDLERESVALFAGNHQVVVARRHFTDGAVDDWQNAGSRRL